MALEPTVDLQQTYRWAGDTNMYIHVHVNGTGDRYPQNLPHPVLRCQHASTYPLAHMGPHLTVGHAVCPAMNMVDRRRHVGLCQPHSHAENHNRTKANVPLPETHVIPNSVEVRGSHEVFPGSLHR